MRKFEIAKGFEDGGVIIPQRKTAKSAGYDIVALTNEDVYLSPGQSVNLVTGLKACMEDDEVMLLFIRSSLGIKKGITLSNSCAVIDADYYNNPDNEGEIFFQIINLSPFPIMLHKGDAIGQGIIKKYMTTIDDEANGSRSGGFGSTDMGHSDESAMASAT